MTDPRFPVEPLAAAAGITLGEYAGAHSRPGNEIIAELVGVKPRWARQLRHRGLTEAQADRAATALGLHPLAIWPTEWAESVLNAHLPPAARRNAAKTHCPQGHPYTHTDSRGKRCCRYCHAANVRKIRQKPENAQRVQVVTQPELWEAS